MPEVQWLPSDGGHALDSLNLYVPCRFLGPMCSLGKALHARTPEQSGSHMTFSYFSQMYRRTSSPVLRRYNCSALRCVTHTLLCHRYIHLCLTRQESNSVVLMACSGGLRLGRQSIVKALRASLERMGLQSIQLYQACSDSLLHQISIFNDTRHGMTIAMQIGNPQTAHNS